MQKHDKMVALAKEKSAEMTETAITAIESMYRKNEKISVAELTKLTGLSRGFFYNNPNVKQVMMELKEKQQDRHCGILKVMLLQKRRKQGLRV